MTKLQTQMQAALAKLGNCPSPGTKFRNGELMNLLRFIVNERKINWTQREITKIAVVRCPGKRVTSAACSKALDRLVREGHIGRMKGGRPFLYYSLLQPKDVEIPSLPDTEIIQEPITFTGDPEQLPFQIPLSTIDSFWLVEKLHDEIKDPNGKVEVSISPGMLHIKTESFVIAKRLSTVKESKSE